MRPTLLLHICCAPCLVSPYRYLREQFAVTGFWWNHNIHPFTEYQNRLACVRAFVKDEHIDYIEHDHYGLVEFIRGVVDDTDNRCISCYRERLEFTARYAAEHDFDYFSTTLLYSRRQKHEMIKRLAEELSAKYNIAFFYKDFREHWEEGIALSKQAGLYRQKYCGCIYSEMDRYLGRFK